MELRVLKDQNKVAMSFREEVKKRYGAKFEEVMFKTVDPVESTRIKLETIVNYQMKELML